MSRPFILSVAFISFWSTGCFSSSIRKCAGKKKGYSNADDVTDTPLPGSLQITTKFINHLTDVSRLWSTRCPYGPALYINQRETPAARWLPFNGERRTNSSGSTNCLSRCPTHTGCQLLFVYRVNVSDSSALTLCLHFFSVFMRTHCSRHQALAFPVKWSSRRQLTACSAGTLKGCRRLW